MDHPSEQSQEQSQQQSEMGPQCAPAAAIEAGAPIEAQKRELEQIRKTLGLRHPKVAELLSTIGLYYQHMDRDLSVALSYYEQALSVLCSQPGNGASYEVEIAVTLTDVGNVYQCLNRNDEAVKAYEQAMAIFEEKAMSGNHPSIQMASRGLALLRARCSNPESGILR